MQVEWCDTRLDSGNDETGPTNKLAIRVPISLRQLESQNKTKSSFCTDDYLMVVFWFRFVVVVVVILLDRVNNLIRKWPKLIIHLEVVRELLLLLFCIVVKWSN